MDRVSDLMGKVLSKRGLKDEAKAAHLVFLATVWIEENLPDVSQKLHPKQMIGSSLLVESDHSIASQELQNASEKLKTALYDQAGVKVTEVRITLSNHSN